MIKGPDIIAKFKVDSEGRPRFRQAPGSDVRHYEITLRSAVLPSTESVTYRLHPSYYDPVREVHRTSQDDAFEEEITAYGDYEIEVSTSGAREGETRSRELLSRALTRGHDADLAENPEIRQVIDKIRGL